MEELYRYWIMRRRKRCVECGKNWADLPSPLCPGCAAYQEHLQMDMEQTTQCVNCC